MLIKLGEIVSQASGTLRGTTYSHNRYGAYVRNGTIPVNPQSDRQTTVRSFFQDLTQHWSQTLTQAQRDQWTTYGENVPILNRLGDQVLLTGLGHYIRSNVPRLLAGLTRVDAGPVIFTLPEVDSAADCGYTADDQKCAVAFTDTLDVYDEDDAALLVYVGNPVNPTIDFFNGPFRFADSIDGDSVTPPTSPTEVDSPFTIQTAQRVYHRFRITRADGRLSNFFRLGSAIVAAS
jgi:hypothetical protein